MISSINLDQFIVKPSGVSGLPCLVPKNGSGSLKSLFAEKAAQDEEKLRAFMAKTREEGTSVHLTREQEDQLSAKFRPNDMSYEDYHAFVDQLCQWGVLDREDIPHVSVSPVAEGLIPVDFSEPVGTLTSARTDRRFSRDFSSSGGNVLDWARYLATFEDFNPDTRAFEKTRSAILFGKIRDILELIR